MTTNGHIQTPTLWTPVGEIELRPPPPAVPPEQQSMVAEGDFPAPPEEDNARKATQLPTPSGYRILCAVPEVERSFGSGLLKSDITLHNEELLCTVLFVISLGPDCYTDKARFPSGPWCKEGDFVLVRPHTGTRVKIHGKEMRLLNDDCIEAVVEDPRGISRAF